MNTRYCCQMATSYHGRMMIRYFYLSHRSRSACMRRTLAASEHAGIRNHGAHCTRKIGNLDSKNSVPKLGLIPLGSQDIWPPILHNVSVIRNYPANGVREARTRTSNVAFTCCMLLRDPDIEIQRNISADGHDGHFGCLKITDLPTTRVPDVNGH